MKNLDLIGYLSVNSIQNQLLCSFWTNLVCKKVLKVRNHPPQTLFSNL